MTPTTTETVPRVWGEREGVTLELLAKFTNPDRPRFSKPQCVWSPRGDFTESGERRLRATMTAEAYEHLHWDTVACTGGILVCVPRWKSSPDRGADAGLPAPYWWAMEEIAKLEPDPQLGVRPASENEISRVVAESRELLSELPGLQFMQIQKVGFYRDGKPKRHFEDAPQNVRFFRFAAGYGCVAI